jgi:predicted dinucleotide-utilizing enzyme
MSTTCHRRTPATSYLAALSVLTLLRDLDDPLQVGT